MTDKTSNPLLDNLRNAAIELADSDLDITHVTMISQENEPVQMYVAATDINKAIQVATQGLVSILNRTQKSDENNELLVVGFMEMLGIVPDEAFMLRAQALIAEVNSNEEPDVIQ